MNRLSKFVLTVAVVAFIAAPVCAQQQRRGGGGGRGAGAGMGPGGMSQLGLLAQKSVQEELKLTPDQVEKVTEAQRKQQGARQGFADLSPEERTKKIQEMAKETDKLVADMLKPDQAKRLKQIQLQQQGAMAFNNPEVAKALNFTAEQKQKLKDIQDMVAKERAALRQGGGDRQEAAKKIADLTKKTNTEALALLTADQKAKWKEMTGEPFKGEITQGGGRRPRNDR
jgi:hypothetical protein